MRKHRIRAVHEQDLEDLLNSLGLSESMAKGELKCGICGSIVNLDNLYAEEYTSFTYCSMGGQKMGQKRLHGSRFVGQCLSGR